MPKQHNVQQQNASVKSNIQRLAGLAQETPGAIGWLDPVLASGSLEQSSGILVHLVDIPEQGGGHELHGIWLTRDKNFWLFEAVASYEEPSQVTVERFENVTPSMEVSEHLQGTGKSFGWLALEVLDERLGTSW